MGSSGARLVRASTLTGLSIVTLGGDREVEVKDVVFDKTVGGITGFTLRKPGLLGGPQKQVLPVAGVHAIGPDAVMIPGHDVFSGAEALVDSGDDVLGDRVITDDGVELGTVTDVVATVTAGAADIVAFALDPTEALGVKGSCFLPLPVALAISGEAIVVPAAARDLITTEESELEGAVHALRSQGGPAA